MSLRRVFLDMEFTSLDVNDMELVSIAVVADDDNYFYAELNDFDQKKCSAFVEEAVLPKLLFKGEQSYYKSSSDDKGFSSASSNITLVKENKRNVAETLDSWFQKLDVDVIEIWGDVLPFDWVLFVNLFGGDALELPEYIYYIPFDIATYLQVKGLNPDINREEFVRASGVSYPDEIKQLPQHNALRDGFTTLYTYLILENMR